jgi:hypothetical protein
MILMAVSLVLCGVGHARSSEAESKAGAKQILVPKINNSPSQKALGPQPEPPDKPSPGSKSLGPQPEPPDTPQKGTNQLSPQPEPADRI